MDDEDETEFNPIITPVEGSSGDHEEFYYRSAAAHTPTTENSNSNNNNNNNKSISDNRMLVFVPPHSLIKHWVSVLRNEQTPPPIFKNAMAELGRLLIYEASRDWLPTVNGEIQSPMGVDGLVVVELDTHGVEEICIFCVAP